MENVDPPDAAAQRAAARAAARAGVAVRSLRELPELADVKRLFHGIWRPDDRNPMVSIELLRALAHAGNYLSGAFAGDALVGASLAFLTAPPGVGLHSHITGVADPDRRRGVGFALKLHQRAWALAHGLREVTWTFDPLVRRNAYFNLVKLAARPREYLVDFYGEVEDAINAGQGTDRLLVAWELAAPAVAQACAGRWAESTMGGPAALIESDAGGPEVAPVAEWRRAPVVLVQVPADIEGLRASDPGRARSWRLAVREVLGGLLGGGARVTGFTRAGWYVVERTTA